MNEILKKMSGDFVYWIERKDFNESELEDMIKCYHMLKRHVQQIRDKTYPGHHISIKIVQYGSGEQFTEWDSTEWDVSGVIFKPDKSSVPAMKHPLRFDYIMTKSE